jgi:hypothetical protein
MDVNGRIGITSKVGIHVQSHSIKLHHWLGYDQEVDDIEKGQQEQVHCWSAGGLRSCKIPICAERLGDKTGSCSEWFMSILMDLDQINSLSEYYWFKKRVCWLTKLSSPPPERRLRGHDIAGPAANGPERTAHGQSDQSDSVSGLPSGHWPTRRNDGNVSKLSLPNFISKY